jgi:hypothetical protein
MNQKNIDPLECLKTKIDLITNVSDFIPDDLISIDEDDNKSIEGYDYKSIEGYENQIKEYVKNKINPDDTISQDKIPNINLNKIFLKQNILNKIDENSTLTDILKLLKYSNEYINKLKSSISSQLKKDQEKFRELKKMLNTHYKEKPDIDSRDLFEWSRKYNEILNEIYTIKGPPKGGKSRRKKKRTKKSKKSRKARKTRRKLNNRHGRRH